MKNNKFTKITLAILAFALCISAAFAMTISAAEDTHSSGPAPKIISQNVEYGDQYKLMYAVAAEDITTDVTLRVYDHEPEEGSQTVYEGTVKNGETTTISAGGVSKTVYKFTTQAISQLSMLQVFYVQAEANGQKSPVKTYSIAEYLYQRLSDPTATETQQNFYKTTIAYGDGLTTVCHKSTDPALTDADFLKNYRYVQVEGGTVNGKATGLYLIGTELSLVSDNSNPMNYVLYGAGGLLNALVTSETAVFTYQIPTDVADAVGVKFTTGDPIVINYPEGYLTFDSWTDLSFDIGALGTPCWTNSAMGDQTKMITGREGGTFGLKDSGEDKYKKVLELTMANSNNSGSFFVLSNTEKTSETDPDIFEVSFDLKVTAAGNEDNGGDSVGKEYNVLDATGEMVETVKADSYNAIKLGFGGDSFLTNVAICYELNGATNAFYFWNEDKGSDWITAVNVNTYGWNHFRFYATKTDPDNIYIEVNGVAAGTIDIDKSNNKVSGSMAAYLYRSGIMANSAGHNSTVLIDNLYVGRYNLTAEE